MQFLLHKLFYKRIRKPVKRKFNADFFKKSQNQELFARNGFVHLPGLFDNSQLGQLLNVYNKIANSPEFEKTDYYVNTVSFKSESIKKKVRTEVPPMTESVLSSEFNFEKLRFPISVGYCINPPNSTSGSRPHQDPALVDETKTNSLVFWISLTDTNKENGCLHVLKGSHLWGNYLRSNYHVYWPFDNLVDTLIWEHMEAIPTKAGDVIVFDPALIHGSTPNTTANDRLGIQISAVPVKEDIITIVEEKGWPFSKALFYKIDETYFTEESVSKKPSNRFPVIKKVNFDYYYNTNDIRSWLKSNSI